MKKLLFLLTIIFFFTTCEKEDPVQIGNPYQGGIIFYINNEKGFGLIAAKEQLPSWYPWGPEQGRRTGTTRWDFGQGDTNTQIIVDCFGAGNYAAKACYDLVLEGYDDWYLPDNYEMVCVYNFFDMVHHNPTRFWTSTELPYEVVVVPSPVGISFPRTTELSVYPIRKFLLQ